MPTRNWIRRLQTILRRHHRKNRRRVTPAAAGPAGINCLPMAELLEDRTLLTAYVVDTVADDPLATASDTDGLVSLREAIQAANANAAFGDAAAGDGGAVDTITFAPSLTGQTIVLGGAELTISDDLTVTGLGSDDLTISGNNDSRVFYVEAGVSAQLIGLTIMNGYATDGGGIFNLGTLAVSESVLTNNTAEVDGGAIKNDVGNLTLKNTTFSGNMAYDQGGAVWNDGTLIVTENSTFDANRSEWEGGAIWNSGSLEVAEGVFVSNSAYQGGGAIANREGGIVNVMHSSFAHNDASDAGFISQGGAIYSFRGLGGSSAGQLHISNSSFVENSSDTGGAIWNDAPATVVASTFVGNTAAGFGGAIRQRLDVITITDSTISGNSAQLDGGGIENFFGTVELINSTLSGNSAGRWGGAIDNWGGKVYSTNSTIVLNRADANGNDSGTGGGIFNFSSSSIALLNNTLLAGNVLGAVGSDTPNDIAGAGVDPLSTRNLIGDVATSGGLLHGDNGNIVGNAGVGTIDITTVLDTTLADNGGPTLTHALVAGSLAIDAGDNSLSSAATDQTGSVRILDGDGDGIATIDIGAVELVTTAGVLTFLSEQIDELGEVGVIRFGEETSLLMLLTQAEHQYQAQNFAGSTSLLEAFLLRVRNLRDRGVLDVDQAVSLISAAEQLLAEIETV